MVFLEAFVLRLFATKKALMEGAELHAINAFSINITTAEAAKTGKISSHERLYTEGPKPVKRIIPRMRKQLGKQGFVLQQESSQMEF